MIHFLDTSFLKWAYFKGRNHRRCRYIISRLKTDVYIAEISILELVSALGGEVRANRITASEYASADRTFWRDIANGRISVVAFPAPDYLPCRHLLAYVGVEIRRALSSQDAVVAYCARSLAQERGEQIRFLTCDRRLAKVVTDVDIFRRLVKAEYCPP